MPEYLMMTNLNATSSVCSGDGESFESKDPTSFVVKDIYEKIMKRASVGELDGDDISKSEKGNLLNSNNSRGRNVQSICHMCRESFAQKPT